MSSRARTLCLILLATATALPGQDRMKSRIDPSRRAILKGSRNPRALAQFDRGPVDPSMKLSYATLHFKPAPSIEMFLSEQQSPSSANYHRWLTPEQFADHFGLSKNDVTQAADWLKAEGLTVHDVARGRNWITFSGTAQKVGRAFRTQLHHYQVDGETHFAPVGEPSVPEALQPLVSGIVGLDDFEPESLLRRSSEQPAYNIGNTHYLAPDDLATIYNITSLYQAGINGTGQRLAVIGRTAVDLEDTRAFRRRFGLPANDPQLLLFGTDPGKTADEGEANLDLQWSGAVARNATIVYVYSTSVRTSAQYAVDQNIAPVMTYSYGACELTTNASQRGVAQQANAQGITWMVSSGDAGSATCDTTSPTPQASKGPTASFPASLPEVTAVGGTEFNEGTGNYWNAVNTSNLASARSYIPEKPWNSSLLGTSLFAGGGGPSGLYAKPYWQKGPGVPDDKARDVPDISLTASGDHDGYYVVLQGRGVIFGGTSASAPAFAGMVALLNQYQKSPDGQGNINPSLYRMAQSNPGAFHDITEGDIKVPCTQGSPGCVDGLLGYAATPNYDLATGLGSVDAYRLVTEWNTGKSSNTVVTASREGTGVSGTATVTVNVSGDSGTPSGTVILLANDALIASAELASGGAVLTVDATLIAAGNNVVTAFYGGDASYGSSSGKVTVAFEFPPSAAVILVSLNPNPVIQVGNSWPYIVSLTEKAGVAATIASFTVNGTNQTLPGGFLTTSLPANGTLSSSLSGIGLLTPLNRIFRFSGTDANGKSWTAEATVPFLPSIQTPLTPAIALSVTSSNIQQNNAADPSCAWQVPLLLQEKGGFSAQVTLLRSGTTDISSDIQKLFGTARLAPLGTLRANVCVDRSTALGNRLFTVNVVSELGNTILATASATLSDAPASSFPMALSPQAVTIPLTNSSQTGSSTVSLNFGTGSPAWRVTVQPVSAGPTWLTTNPQSGTGSGQLKLNVDGAGLSNGVYFAKVVIQGTDTLPQLLELPVTLVVGASAATSIAGVANGASFQTAFAPGMVLSVFGTNLAPSTVVAARIPLPLFSNGVSATVNGVSAPFYFVSAGQLNIQVPYETSKGTAVVGVNNNGQVTAFSIEVTASAPGIFASNGSLVPSASGKPGDVLLAFITGDGDLSPSLATGATPSSTTSIARLPKPKLPLTLTVGGIKADVAFAGVPSGLSGVTQINFTIPLNTPAGVQPVVVNVGGVDSPAVNLNIRAQ